MVSRKEDVFLLCIIRFCFKLSHTDIFILFDHVVKPGNLLCDGANNRLRLIDFGSGADLDPSSPPSAKQQQSSNGLGNIFSTANGKQQEEQQKQRVGFDEGIAALSPIYRAPETFIKLDANPLSFDVFSAAVMMCQLLFNTLDERSNTELTQQLREVEYDLDAWLENSLGDEMIGPSRFDDALEYLGERRGLWGLLKKMLQPNPMNRISSAMALESLREVLALKSGEMKWSDENIARVALEESYLETVIDSFDKCTISYGDGQDDNRPRPLHFLASFTAGMPVGLVLSEASGDDIDENSDMSEEAKRKWKEATKFAFPGEVFVKGWSTNGQADKLGVFGVGDRLRGVGELPFTNAGFEAAVDLVSGSHDITRMICIVAESHLSLFTLSRVNADRSNGSR
jgi:serine/threonine protein kinase